jgi:hypothetical protein
VIGCLRVKLEDRKRHQLQIDQLVKVDASEVARLDQEIAVAARTATEARKTLRTAADRNQIYRLAASWYGVSTSDVTEEQFATARWVFSTFSAVAVALAGSIAALVYYARSRVPGAPTLVGKLVVKLLNARRAYFARKRKPLKVEVPGPERVIYRDGKEPPVVVEHNARGSGGRSGAAQSQDGRHSYSTTSFRYSVKP